MELNFLTVWAAYGGGTDILEPNELIGWFSEKSSAEKAARNQGWYGGPGRVASVEALCMDDSIYYALANSGKPIDLDDKKSKADNQRREQALSKLTQEDIELLGIKAAKS